MEFKHIHSQCTNSTSGRLALSQESGRCNVAQGGFTSPKEANQHFSTRWIRLSRCRSRLVFNFRKKILQSELVWRSAPSCRWQLGIRFLSLLSRKVLAGPEHCDGSAVCLAPCGLAPPIFCFLWLLSTAHERIFQRRSLWTLMSSLAIFISHLFLGSLSYFLLSLLLYWRTEKSIWELQGTGLCWS